MKILWITNILFPEANALLSSDSALKGSGGWLTSSIIQLKTKFPEIEIAVATVSNRVTALTKLKGTQTTYFILPFEKGNRSGYEWYMKHWEEVKSQWKPDIVHIHGSEYTHGLAYIKACGSQNVILSIQGLISVIADHFTDGISEKEIKSSCSIFNKYLHNSLTSLKSEMKSRSCFELDMIRGVNHIIGRTTWDKSHVWAINPDAHYYHCDETMREEFYSGKWNYDSCTPHSIFLSQANTPFKGALQLMKALPIIQAHYPDVTVRIGGFSPILGSGRMAALKRDSYSKLLSLYIEKGGFSKVVTFVGSLDAQGMKKEYLKANVFLMPSSIENSPNSLAEAQLLGVPVVASYVGGVNDMIPNSDCGETYRFEEVEMLAYKICKIFEIEGSFDGTTMIQTAQKRHDRISNVTTLYNIYRKVLNNE